MLKSGTATLVAVFFLVTGVEVAHAGGIGDVTSDAASAAESALPAPEETDLRAVVEDAAGGVDVETAVSEAATAVDEVAADPRGTVESVEQTTGAVKGGTDTVGRIIEKTPTRTVAKDVARAVDPVVSGVDTRNGLIDLPAAATPTNRKAASPASEAKPQAFSTVAPASPPGASVAEKRAAMPPVTAEVIRVSTGHWPTETGWRPTSSGWKMSPLQAPASTNPATRSSAVPAVPFAPSPPGDSPATAVSIAGATAAALLAALVGALLFLAPRTGRLARPGPILVRAEPCLSLPERPG